MKKEQAINLTEQVFASYKGTLQDHLNLAKALETLNGLVEVEVAPTEVPKSKSKKKPKLANNK